MRIHLALIGLFCLAAIAEGQTISNGNFENAKVAEGYWVSGLSADGWTFNGKSGIARGSSAWGQSGHSGPQYAYIQSDGHGIGIFSQVVDGLTIGQRYRVSFWMARRNTTVPLILAANVAAPIELLVDNKVILPFTVPKGQGGWNVCYSRSFVASSKGITLTFMAETCTKDQSTLVDDVVLTPVPSARR